MADRAEGASSEVVLNPAVVEAIATMNLSVDGSIEQNSFFHLVRELAASTPNGFTEDEEVLSVDADRAVLTSGNSLQRHNLAARLISYEKLSGETTAAAFQVCERLRVPLTSLTGSLGFHSLLRRAVALGKRDDPRLASVRLNDQGSLEGLDNEDTQGTVLIGHLIKVPAEMIGEGLTMRLFHEIWPELGRSA